MLRTYSTRTEAIQAEIITPIENGDATRNEYNIDAIASETLGDYTAGFALTVDTEEFWEIVQRHAK